MYIPTTLRNALLISLLGVCALAGCSDGSDDNSASNNDTGIVEDMAEVDASADLGAVDASSDTPEDTPDAAPDQPESEPDMEPDTNPDDPDMGADQGVDMAPDMEVDMGVDPCSLDTDNDLISDCDEDLLGTDKTKGDTDGDGLFDFEEFQNSTDPLAADSDGDGLTDLEEIKYGLNPNNPATYNGSYLDSELWITRSCDDVASEPVNYYKSSNGDWLLALPPAFNNYVEPVITNAGPRQALAVFDDPANEVAGFVLSLDDSTPNNGQSLQTLLAHKAKISNAAVGSVVQNVEEGAFDTHDLNKAAPGRYLFTVSNKSAKKVRDDILFRLTPFSQADVTGMPVAAGNAYNSYRVFVTVIDRGRRSITLVAVAPANRFDARDAVQFRMYDLTNTTSIAQSGDDTELVCHPFPTSTQVPTADFYLILDQSGSMIPYNNKLKDFAEDFFTLLRNTALDFRVGITNMDPATRGKLRPQTGWLNSSTSITVFNAEITNYVTACSGCSGGEEYGLWVGQEGIRHMRSAAAAPAERIRADAQVVSVAMSDEEDNSYLDGSNPNNGPNVGAAQILRDFKAFYLANSTLHAIVLNEPGSSYTDGYAYREVALASGGITADLDATSLEETIVAIIENTAGRASTFRLPSTPISASLRVYRATEEDPKVGQWVPRSRVDGFDYFPQTNSVAFFGTYRPRASVQACANTTECVAGSICNSGRCRFPVQVAVQYQAFVDRTKISD